MAGRGTPFYQLSFGRDDGRTSPLVEPFIRRALNALHGGGRNGGYRTSIRAAAPEPSRSVGRSHPGN